MQSVREKMFFTLSFPRRAPGCKHVFLRWLKSFLPLALLLAGLAANGSDKTTFKGIETLRKAKSVENKGAPEKHLRETQNLLGQKGAFVDFPVTVRSESGPAGDTRLRFGAGVRGGQWPLKWGHWRLGFDASGVLLAPLADGSTRVFVTPYTVELTGRGLLGYTTGSRSVAFVPYGFMGSVAQLTLVHLRTFAHNALSFDGDMAAMLGPGLAIYVGRWLVRLDLGGGYGLHGPLWRTTLGIGIGQALL